MTAETAQTIAKTPMAMIAWPASGPALFQKARKFHSVCRRGHAREGDPTLRDAWIFRSENIDAAFVRSRGGVRVKDLIDLGRELLDFVVSDGRRVGGLE